MFPGPLVTKHFFGSETKIISRQELIYMPLLCTQTGFSCPVGVLIWPVVHVSMDVLLLSEKGRHFLNGTLITADDCMKVQSLFRSEGDKLRPWPYLRSDICPSVLVICKQKHAAR